MRDCCLALIYKFSSISWGQHVTFR